MPKENSAMRPGQQMFSRKNPHFTRWKSAWCFNFRKLKSCGIPSISTSNPVPFLI